MVSEPEQQLSKWAALFDGLSDAYDQSGVPFFGRIARGLVEGLDLQPGQRVLDLGAGRGAATFPAAAAVGDRGRVDTLDLAPGMVRRLGEDTRALRQVHVGLGDAADPHPPAAPYDAVMSSLVVFFLDDPAAALTRWRALLRPGGRVGVATFQPSHGAWRELDELEEELSGQAYEEDPRFGTDEGVAGLLRSAGFTEVRTELASYSIVFADAQQWRTWSWATPLGGLWRRTDPSLHDEVMRRATEILDRSRDADGRPVLEVGVRYTYGTNPQAT